MDQKLLSWQPHHRHARGDGKSVGLESVGGVPEMGGEGFKLHGAGGCPGAGGSVLNEFDMEQSFAAWLGALERINFQSRYGPRSCFFERYSSLG